MAKQLRSMTIQALIALRDDVTGALKSKAETLKSELNALGADYAEVGRIALFGKKKKALAGRKVAAKYRDPKTGETWSGRGARAGWLAAYVKAGRKAESFLIGAKPVKKKRAKVMKAKNRAAKKRAIAKRMTKKPVAASA